MDLKRLAPWNWFKKEEETGSSLPVRMSQGSSVPASTRFQRSMDQFYRETDRLFGDMFQDFGFGGQLTPLDRSQFLRPQVDIGANEKEYSITIEVPGINEKDVKIEVSENTMTIRGEKRQEKEEDSKEFYRMERSYGSFQRVLSLPDDAEKNEINATFKNGVIYVTMPRKALSKSSGKKIEIREM